MAQLKTHHTMSRLQMNDDQMLEGLKSTYGSDITSGDIKVIVR
jgi:hypothetical protein